MKTNKKVLTLVILGVLILGWAYNYIDNHCAQIYPFPYECHYG